MTEKARRCCGDFDKFLLLIDEHIESGSMALSGEEEGTFKPFKKCPYCSESFDKAYNQPIVLRDDKKRFQLQWDERLSLGIPWIDSQHKKLLEQMNILLNTVIREKGLGGTGKAIRFLKQYIDAHFGTEESIMRKYGYPLHDSHRKNHIVFNRKVQSFSDEFEKKGASAELMLRITKELWAWYKDHITKCDSEFGDFLKNRLMAEENRTASDMFDNLMKKR